MASLYPHKKYGYQINYVLTFVDGAQLKKYKTYKSKTKAHLAFREIEKLEILTAQQKLTQEDVTYFLHKKYIRPEEIDYLSKGFCRLHPDDITWDKLEQVYKDHIKMVGSVMTQKTYPSKLTAIREYFGAYCPVEIDKQRIREFILYQRDKGRQKSTCNKYLSILRVMFDYLVQEKAIKENPARKIKYFTQLEERVPRILYPEEFKMFLSKLQGFSHLCHGYFAEMVLTYLYTGMRRYELVYLKRDAVNFGHKTITIQGKGSKERIIEIHPALVPVLKAVIKKNNGNKGFYFFGGKNSPTVSYDRMTKSFKKFVSDIKLPEGIKLHSLRHTFISYLLAAGADIKYVQSIAGHEKLTTTQRYTHLIPRKKAQVGLLSYE